MKKIFFLLGLVLSFNSSAGLIVDTTFEFGWRGDFSFTGSFTGEDIDNDGFLRFDELTSLVENRNNHNLSTLFDIGDIDIANEKWIANGIAWSGTADVAFMTFDNRAWSCNTSNGCNTRFTSFNTNAQIPEPESLLLLSLGLIGLSFSRKKKSS